MTRQRLVLTLLILATSCLPRGGGGAATGQIVLPQTARPVSGLRVSVIDGLRGFSCASGPASLTAAPKLVSAQFDLESRSGRIDNIPAGEARVFWFEALTDVSGGEVVATGCRDGIRINPGEVRDLGQVLLNPAAGVTLTFEAESSSGSVGDIVTLRGKGFPNELECVQVTFAGRLADGTVTRQAAVATSASPTSVTVQIPLGAVTGTIQATVTSACADPPLQAQSATSFQVIPVVKAVVYSANSCGTGTVTGAREGDVVELRGTGFSPRAAENRVQITGFSAVRAAWAAAGITVDDETVDTLRFVVPRGLPAGLLPVAISVELPEQTNAPISPAVSFRVLPTLREVRPPFAPTGGTLHLDMAGTSRNESENLIAFLDPDGAETALTFPTLVQDDQVSVLVPNVVGDGFLSVEVAGECSNQLPFARANVLAGSLDLPEKAESGATLATSPTGSHLGGTYGPGKTQAFLVTTSDGTYRSWTLDKPTGPAFDLTGKNAYFLERGKNKLHRVDLSTMTRSEVALLPALDRVHGETPLRVIGDHLYVLTQGTTDNVVRIDPRTGQTAPLLGVSGLCQRNGNPVVALGARYLHAAPAADLLSVITVALGKPKEAILLFATRADGFCHAEVAPDLLPAAAVGFGPGLTPEAYLAPLTSGPLQRVSLRRGSSENQLVVQNLPARLPSGIVRMLVTPDGGRLLAIGPSARAGIDPVQPGDLSTVSSFDLNAVDLKQGGVTIPISERARETFGAIAIDAIQVSLDGKTLYVPTSLAGATVPSPSGAGGATLFHVDLDAFLADTQGTSVGVSSLTYGVAGTAYASALSPDGSRLHVLSTDLQVLLPQGRLYSFAQRPQGPFRLLSYNEFAHSDAAYTPNEQHLIAPAASEDDAWVLYYRVGTWVPEPTQVPLIGFRLPRVYVNHAHDLALVAPSEFSNAGAVSDKVCLLRNLSQSLPTQCEMVTAGPADRVEFAGPFALLHRFGTTQIKVLNLVGPPVPITVDVSKSVNDVFGIPGAMQALIIHRSDTGVDEVSLLDFASRQLVVTKPLDGTPGLAALDPDGKRLLVPLVDSPFVNLVEVQGTTLKVTRLSTFGGIHLATAFHSVPQAQDPAPRLEAYAFDVLRDGLTRFSFSGAQGIGGTTIDGLAVANATVPIDRSARIGLTDDDFVMILATARFRIAPVAVAADSRTLWVNTGESSEVTAVDMGTRKVVARVPLPGSAVGPRQMVPTTDGKWLVVRDVLTGRLHIVDTGKLTNGS